MSARRVHVHAWGRSWRPWVYVDRCADLGTEIWVGWRTRALVLHWGGAR